jgi:hypothetical protein
MFLHLQETSFMDSLLLMIVSVQPERLMSVVGEVMINITNILLPPVPKTELWDYVVGRSCQLYRTHHLNDPVI